jgi:hypothetical protein
MEPVPVCCHEACWNDAYAPHDECYRHRLLSVGFSLKSPATVGNFHRTVRDYREEHFGTNSERELAARGIERVDKI